VALSEYEQRIWEEVASELTDAENIAKKVESEEIDKPYSLRIIVSVFLLVGGFVAMIASVAYENTLTGVTAFGIAFTGGIMLTDALKYKGKRFSAPRNSRRFDDIWKRLNNN